jgi:hypothetical protein
MRKVVVISTVAAGLLGAVLIGHANRVHAGEDVDRPMVPYYAFCRSIGPPGTAIYFSATQPIDAGVAREDLEKSFRGYLTGKYKYPNDRSVTCWSAYGVDLQARTELSRQQVMTNLRTANYEVVEIDWKYSK